MSKTIIQVQPFDMVVFGASGDLALRKLFPSLYLRDIDGQIPKQARFIGSSLETFTHEEFCLLVEKALRQYIPPKELDENLLKRFLKRLSYQSRDVTEEHSWEALKQQLDEMGNGIRVYYLAVAPRFFSIIANGLASVGLNGDNARLVVEKPFGHDGESAKALNSALAESFTEDQIYRIDHYLGKETVQNLLAFRFANSLFEPQWNSHSIDHVQITVAESLGVGTRGHYYDTVGAMRDMVQNHLIQLLCLIAMESPYAFEANALRDEKIKVLKSLVPLKGHTALKNTIRGQYLSSVSEPSYRDEVENETSQCETYVAIKAEIDNYRWNGVPFFLRTGKKLREQMAEISIIFKKPHHSLFNNLSTPIKQNTLVLRLQPDEGLSLSVMTKNYGPGGFTLDESILDMSFEHGLSEGERVPDSYERLLMDVVRGNQTLFMRRDEVEEAWQWIDPIMEAWSESGEEPEFYDPGSHGPAGAFEMMADSGRRWRNIKI